MDGIGSVNDRQASRLIRNTCNTNTLFPGAGPCQNNFFPVGLLFCFNTDFIPGFEPVPVYLMQKRYVLPWPDSDNFSPDTAGQRYEYNENKKLTP